VLFGGAGDDLLVGGGGRDFLIGGHDSDRLVGNADDDILVAGIVSHEENPTAIDRIMQEWTSACSYAVRTDHIAGGSGGLNDDFYLATEGESLTVLDDNAKDMLTGSAGQDWYFANLFLDNGDDAEQKDKITDLSANEFALDLDFISGD
jgi:Ca2+-binding RTX toxin-like protein